MDATERLQTTAPSTTIGSVGGGGAPKPGPAPGDDPYSWLEEVTGDAPLTWAREHNTATLATHAGTARFAEIQTEIREVLDAETRIPYVVRRGEYLYNFWQDATNPRGLWRRTTLDQYRAENPDWELLIDVDALAAAEGQNWVWHGSSFLAPGYEKCLVSLSVGGADADVTREFDPVARKFVDGGFTVPEAKSSCGWVDADTLYVGTDFGPGSLTDSGYPRVMKRWQRGTPLEAAETVFEGEATDVSVHAWRDPLSGRDFLTRSVDFYRRKRYLLVDGASVALDVPDDAEISVHTDHLTVELRSDWTVAGQTFASGALLAIDFDRFLAGDRDFQTLFAPDEHSALASYHWTEHALLLSSLVDVRPSLEVLIPAEGWARRPAAPVPDWCSISVLSTDRYHGDEYLLAVDGYLTPPELHRLVAGVDGPAEVLKRSPARFEASGLSVAQHFATSADGTRVPYFVVGPAGSKARPTLLTGYGGFEIAMLPGYDGGLGRAWLARGGVYVVANIRGGGEYGPRWHQAALTSNRPRAYEDFAAVAADLSARGITTPGQLGVTGGSNGGLLTGNMFTGYPELFGAVVIQVPLLDMRRYHRLLAGASWMAEYGDPDDETQWETIRTYSPYHLLAADRAYPPLLVTTSTRDDRVHPGHARKFVAKLDGLGYPVAYYENIEGGHGGASNNEQRAFMRALVFSFLWTTIG